MFSVVHIVSCVLAEQQFMYVTPLYYCCSIVLVYRIIENLSFITYKTSGNQLTYLSSLLQICTLSMLTTWEDSSPK